MEWIGLDWIGLDWIGLDWIGLDWIGSDRIHQVLETAPTPRPLREGELPAASVKTFRAQGGKAASGLGML